MNYNKRFALIAFWNSGEVCTIRCYDTPSEAKLAGDFHTSQKVLTYAVYDKVSDAGCVHYGKPAMRPKVDWK